MERASDGKISAKGVLKSGNTITEKEGYEAMLYMPAAYFEATGSNDLTDIFSAGSYVGGTDRPMDTAYWEYWLEAVQKVKEDGPPRF